MRPQDALRTIRDVYPGALFYRLGNNKRPIDKWKGYPVIDTEDLVAHLDKGRKVSLFPGSIECVVFDVDEGSAEDISSKLSQHLICKWQSESGGWHLFYKSDNPEFGKSKFAVFAEGDDPEAVIASGDLQGNSGYVVCYDLPALAEVVRDIGDINGVNQVSPHLFLSKKNAQKAFGETHDMLLADLRDFFFDHGADASPASIWAKYRFLGYPDSVLETQTESVRDYVRKGRDGIIAVKTDDDIAFKAAVEQTGVSIIFDRRSKAWWYDWGDGEGWLFQEDHFVDRHIQLIRKCVAIPGTKGRMKAWAMLPVKYRHLRKSIAHEITTDIFHELYLKDLRGKWDGVKRLETFLIDNFGAEDTGLNRWAGAAPFLTAVWRTYEKKAYAVDELPVLVGTKGLGKSKALERALPEEWRGRWYSGALNLAADDQKRIEASLGYVFVELAEMKGLKRADSEDIKQFLTRTQDNYRRPYAEDVSEFVRRFAFYGTTNEMESLPNDSDGNRRLVPVELHWKFGRGRFKTDEEPDLDLMDQIRDQLWAEALHIYDTRDQHNIRPRLPSCLYGDLDLISEKHRDKDILEDKIQKMIDDEGDEDFGSLDLNKGETMAAIIEALGMGQKNISNKRMSTALTNCGFESSQTIKDGRRRRVWILNRDSEPSADPVEHVEEPPL